MIDRLEILVEEPSIAEVLRVVLPQILAAGWRLDENCFVRPHDGKQDLQRSIPRKIAAACKKDVCTGFIILQDQDSNDCRLLKEKLTGICEGAMSEKTTRIPYKIRIVCHELEAWYLGDMQALEKYFPRFHADKYRNKNVFRIPDDCVNPKYELKRIVGDYPQIATARALAQNMDVQNNRSASFNCFLKGVEELTGKKTTMI